MKFCKLGLNWFQGLVYIYIFIFIYVAFRLFDGQEQIRLYTSFCYDEVPNNTLIITKTMPIGVASV